jgi:hypothetical protein
MAKKLQNIGRSFLIGMSIVGAISVVLILALISPAA